MGTETQKGDKQPKKEKKQGKTKGKSPSDMGQAFRTAANKARRIAQVKRSYAKKLAQRATRREEGKPARGETRLIRRGQINAPQ